MTPRPSPADDSRDNSAQAAQQGGRNSGEGSGSAMTAMLKKRREREENPAEADEPATGLGAADT